MKNTLVYRKNDAVVIDIQGISAGWEQWFLFTSDEHYDSKYCRRKDLKDVHEEALKRKAGILKFGDIFDCMGGKYDPRTHRGSVRPEYQTANYFQTVERDAAKFYSPYKENILFISKGNHEDSVLKRHEHDLISGLAERLGGHVVTGPYCGYVIFRFLHGKTQRETKYLYYTHGAGGNSPVTKGAINTQRRQSSVQADMFVSGHLHSEFEIPRTITKCNPHGNISSSKLPHWQLGTFEDKHMKDSWEDRKGFDAPSLGGRWVRFFYKGDGANRIKIESSLTHAF